MTELDLADARTDTDPRRYHEAADQALAPTTEKMPVCLYLETTNRCNLACTTCPRTYDELEPPADMSLELFRRILDQVPGISRVVLHGVGEPMLVKELPQMIAEAKARGAYVLFNTNGTVLSAKNGRAIAEAGLDELRVSLDAADAKTFVAVRGKDYFNRIVRNVRAFGEMQAKEGWPNPRVSLWLTGLKETLLQLPEFVRVAAKIGVREVYLQRLVFFEHGAVGNAKADQSLFESLNASESALIEEAQRLAGELGLQFSASGASEPGSSLQRQQDDSPWSACRRPWTVMYLTANGRALPCCIAPFAQHGYDNFTLGDATRQSLSEIWNGAAYREFRSALRSNNPPECCKNCGLRWSL